MTNTDQIDIVANAKRTLAFSMNTLMSDVRKSVQDAIDTLGAKEVQKRLALWAVAVAEDDDDEEEDDEEDEELDADDEELDDDDDEDEDEDDDKYDAP